MKTVRTKEKIKTDMDLSEYAIETAILQMPQIYIGKFIPKDEIYKRYVLEVPLELVNSALEICTGTEFSKRERFIRISVMINPSPIHVDECLIESHTQIDDSMHIDEIYSPGA